MCISGILCSEIGAERSLPTDGGRRYRHSKTHEIMYDQGIMESN